MKVNVHIVKKINLGDYNAVHLGMDVEAELEDVGAADLLWQEVQASLDIQAAPFLAARQVSAEEAGVHEPAVYDGDKWQKGNEGEYFEYDADDCWMVHTETKKGQEAIKIGPHKGKNSMWGIYLWKGVRTTMPVLDDYHDWPMAQQGEQGFTTGKMSLPKEIRVIVVRTDGEYPEIVALR